MAMKSGHALAKWARNFSVNSMSMVCGDVSELVGSNLTCIFATSFGVIRDPLVRA